MFTLLTQEEAKESYGDYRYDEGLEKGLAEGKTLELFSLVKDGILASDIAAKRLNISKAEFDGLYSKWEKANFLHKISIIKIKYETFSYLIFFKILS